MKIKLELEGHPFDIQLPGIDISIPLHFNSSQPNTYGVSLAHAEAYRSGGWVGDVREGGSCNFETISLTPHCNGTHTECIGHITEERFQIRTQLLDSLIPCTVVTVTPRLAAETLDHYEPALGPSDRVIDRDMLWEAMPTHAGSFYKAIAIRSLPNPEAKMQRDYMEESPAFFTLDAMQYLVDLGMQHLLTDLPSVDRLFDEGKLRAHRVFWNVEPGSKSAGEDGRRHATITEMIFLPDDVADGPYLLNLQIAPFMADAAPSRPVLFPINPA